MVGAGYALEGQRVDRCVGKVAVYSHKHTLCRLEVFGLQHHAGYAEGVECRPCREIHGETVEDITFVEIFDGISEVYGIGRVRQQCVAEVDSKTPPV